MLVKRSVAKDNEEETAACGSIACGTSERYGMNLRSLWRLLWLPIRLIQTLTSVHTGSLANLLTEKNSISLTDVIAC